MDVFEILENLRDPKVRKRMCRTCGFVGLRESYDGRVPSMMCDLTRLPISIGGDGCGYHLNVAEIKKLKERGYYDAFAEGVRKYINGVT